VVDERGFACLEYAIALAPVIGLLDGRLAFAAERTNGSAAFRRKTRDFTSVARFAYDVLDEARRLPAEHVAAALVTVWLWPWWLPALAVRAITARATGPTAIGPTAPASAIIPTRGKKQEQDRERPLHHHIVAHHGGYARNTALAPGPPWTSARQASGS
jgi:hypothetical protein